MSTSVEAAIATLRATERGRHVAGHLLRMLDEGGLSLDQDGAAAVLALLTAAWEGGQAGTVLWSLSEAVGLGDPPRR